MHTYYSLLGLTPNASNEEINDSYNKLIPNVQDYDQRNLITKAHKVLSNYHSRRNYDNRLDLHRNRNMMSSFVQPFNDNFFSNFDNFFKRQMNGLNMINDDNSGTSYSYSSHYVNNNGKEYSNAEYFKKDKGKVIEHKKYKNGKLNYDLGKMIEN